MKAPSKSEKVASKEGGRKEKMGRPSTFSPE